jgi:hypothetical protein
MGIKPILPMIRPIPYAIITAPIRFASLLFAVITRIKTGNRIYRKIRIGMRNINDCVLKLPTNIGYSFRY